MKASISIRGLWLAACVLAGSALAQPVASPPRTIEQADATLAQVAKDRAAAESEYATSEQVCYSKFFVNNCLDKAKELRRERLTALRTLEIDANYFKRKYAVEQRDRELEDRNQRDAAEEARRAANPPAPRVAPAEKPATQPGKTPAQRQAEHAARERQRAAETAAEAGERAENVADFQRKQAEAAERQQRVAEKKAEREAKRAKREADAAAKKAAEADRARQNAQMK